MKRIVSILIAPLLLVSLVGCGAFGPSPIQPDPVQTEAAEVQTPTPIPYPVVPEGVVATGTFEPAAVETTGSVTVTKRDDKFIMSVEDFGVDFDGQVMFVLSDTAIKGAECANNGNFQALSSFSRDDGDKNMDVPALVTARYSDDPSYLQTASVVSDGIGEKVDGCQWAFLGIATLDWTLPDMRPDLVLTDSGSRTGAHGIITEDGDYLTTAGDVWSEIAARFGITSDDLEWLNPIRAGTTKPYAYDDEVLNLSKSHRGDTQRRIDYEYDGKFGTLPTQ